MGPHYEKSLLKSCGEDTIISGNVEIRRPHLFSIGSHCAVDTGFYCTTAVEMGDYIHIPPYVTVIGGARGFLRMDHFSGVSAGCRIICASEEFLGEGLIGPTIPHEFKDDIKCKPIIFERFANTGANVVIMTGITLGEGCVVGANSLVTKSTEPWTVYVGSPARPIKTRRKDKMIEYAKRLGYEPII